MAKDRNSGKRTGSRTATRSPVVDDEDEDDQDDESMSDAELLTQIRAAAGKNNGNSEAVALEYLRNVRRVRKVKNRWKKAYEDLLEEMPEGSLVLVGDEADAVRSLIEGRKLDPKKLKELFEKLESDLATATATNLENAGKLLSARIAELTGYDKDAVDAVVRNGNRHIELKEIEVDGTGPDKGKKVKKQWPHVRPKGDEKAALVKFDDYVESDQKYMWPALRQRSTNGTNGQNGQQKSGQTSAVIDGSSAPREGTNGETDPVKASLERDKKRGEKATDPFAIMRGGVPTKAI